MTTYNGGNGSDTIFGGNGDDIIFGGNGSDILFGGAGNDQIYGQNGSDHLIGGAGDDLIDGGSGFDTAYYSGPIEEYTFLASAGYLHVLHLGGTGPDGHDLVIRVERLVFADRVINIGSGVNAPIAGDDHVFITEDAGTYSSGAASVLDNDFDFDGDPLTVTGGTFTGTYGTLTLNANGTYSYTLYASAQALAEGEIVQDSFNYTVSDNDGSDTGTLVFNIAGANDAPTANPDAITAGENDVVLIDVLANDDDVDNGAVLTVTAASAPAGQGAASVVGNQVEFDPGTDFDYLAVGESAIVVVSYDIEDEHGATASSTIDVTVTGTNDGPVANADTATTSENASVVIDVLANDADVDNGAVLTVIAASAPAGQGTASIVGTQVEFDPGTDFDYLAEGESAVVVVDYTIEDEHGAQSASTVTITVEGADDGAVITGTDEGETLTGTNGDDTIYALGGDDTVFGLAGADLIYGGEGHDQLFGDAGNDILVGEQGDDQLSGGEGDDLFDGGDGNDTLAGGNGNDSLSGGDGNDATDGGDGDDSLTDFVGINSFVGGLGHDQIVAGSSSGPQTIDGGGGDDTIRHYYRLYASTITTGTGSDTIEIAHANVGTAAILVTDFTPGAGGDKFRLSGDDGALLSLLSGWDGSSNPFGSGFLRLQQSDADTLLEWDQDGAEGGSNWETLVVFQNTVASAFTDANFVPGYHPDGSPPTGQTITGTEGDDTLTGTVGADTIDALGGNDTVLGLAGADTIYGGDGSDSLHGEADDDVIEGGNDDDFLSGGEGHDQLFGDAGNDILVGEQGDDQLSGGEGDDLFDGGDGNDTLAGGNGNDSLSGGDGNDATDGGDGDDSLTDFVGINSFVGGLGHDQIVAGSSSGPQTIDGGGGDDTIRHYYRLYASTITTGTGSDTIEIAHANVGTAAILVTDFTPGAGGDKFRLSGDDGALLSLLSGWDGSSNPFGSGFLRLQQSDADTLLEWDQDGAEGGSNWETLVVFQNTDASAFTDANFVPGYHPDGSPPAGQTITGTEGDDTLTGTVGADTIDALGGNDTVLGLAGADTIYGGDGSDSLHGEADDDVIEGGNDDDFLSGGEGHDQLFGDAGNDILVGEQGDDQLSGGEGDDLFDGGDGNDTLAGGNGNDSLSGGDGNDIFDFQSALEGPDGIGDFVSGIDQIRVSASGFGGGLVPGGSVSLISGTDPTASDDTGQFLFDTDDGYLLWDADGTGIGGAVLIATLSNLPPLAASDFVVI